MLVVILLIEIALCWTIFIPSYHYDVTSNKQFFSLKLKIFVPSEIAVVGHFFLYCKISNNFHRCNLEWLSKFSENFTEFHSTEFEL